jgi:hypothetical protein
MMDHTKFERRALYHFAHLNEFDAVIVDRGIPVPTLRQIMDMGECGGGGYEGKSGGALRFYASPKRAGLRGGLSLPGQIEGTKKPAGLAPCGLSGLRIRLW